MTNRFFKAILTGAVLAAGTATTASAAECIAPANPGGGWDQGNRLNVTVG